MDKTNEQRRERRILAVCRVLDLKKRFLGFTLDLNHKGIKIIVNKEFPQEEKFQVILNQANENQNINPHLIIKVEQAWRCSSGEEFDQIGGKILEVDSPEQLKNLINYCDETEQDKYKPD